MLTHTGILAEEIAGSPLLAAYILVIVFIFGTVFGSFINCLAWRVVAHESVWKGRSHCAVCNHPLSALDLVPVFSYLLLKGKCRYCGEKISPRYMLTELLMGIIFAAGFLKFGLSFALARYLVLACILLALSLVDFDTYIIPDRFHVAAILNWIIFLPLIIKEDSTLTLVSVLKSSLVGAVAVAAVMLLMSLVFDKLTGKESMGGGDIKLYFVAGLYLGAVAGYLCVLLSCIIGLVMAGAAKKHRIPFGPSISLSILLCMLIGGPIVNWYLGLIF